VYEHRRLTGVRDVDFVKEMGDALVYNLWKKQVPSHDWVAASPLHIVLPV
jgi:hypothetical protein